MTVKDYYRLELIQPIFQIVTLVLIQHHVLLGLRSGVIFDPETMVQGIKTLIQLILAPSTQNFFREKKSPDSIRAQIRFNTCSHLFQSHYHILPNRSIFAFVQFSFLPHFMERIEIIVARVCHLMNRSF